MSFIGYNAFAQEAQESDRTLAWRNHVSAEQSLSNASIDLGRLLTIRDDIQLEIRANNEDMSENLIGAISVFAPIPGNKKTADPTGALTAFTNQIKDTTDAIKLAKAHSDVRSSIMDQYEIIVERVAAADGYYTEYRNLGGRANRVIRSNLVLNVSFKCPSCPVEFSTAVYGGDALTRSETDHFETCGGCNQSYFTCIQKDFEKHQILYCGVEIRFNTTDTPAANRPWHWHTLGICGAEYRRCDDPKKKGVHSYKAISALNPDPYIGYYLKNYKAMAESPHRKGTTTPPAVSIYGPNGVGLPESELDKSSYCGSCIDGHDNCPDALTNHPNPPVRRPSAPQSLSASTGTFRGWVDLKWIAPESNGGAEITHYVYTYRRRRRFGTWTGWEGYYRLTWDASTSGTVTSLMGGFVYEFRVKAVNSEGYSFPSNVASARSQEESPYYLPGWPIKVPQIPNDVSVEKGLYKGQIRLDWTESDSDGGSEITDYEYQYRYYNIGSGRKGWTLPTEWESAGTDMTELISGLRSRTKYQVRMRAKNSKGYSEITNYSGSVTTR